MPEPATLASDPELERIVSEEQACLERVDRNLGARPTTRNRRARARNRSIALLRVIRTAQLNTLLFSESYVLARDQIWTKTS